MFRFEDLSDSSGFPARVALEGVQRKLAIVHLDALGPSGTKLFLEDAAAMVDADKITISGQCVRRNREATQSQFRMTITKDCVVVSTGAPLHLNIYYSFPKDDARAGRFAHYKSFFPGFTLAWI